MLFSIALFIPDDFATKTSDTLSAWMHLFIYFTDARFFTVLITPPTGRKEDGFKDFIMRALFLEFKSEIL